MTDPVDKPVETAPKSEEMQIEVSSTADIATPSFSNLVHGLHSKDRGEVVLDFVYFDERRRLPNNAIPGHTVAKVAISVETAKRLLTVLESFLKS